MMICTVSMLHWMMICSKLATVIHFTAFSLILLNIVLFYYLLLFLPIGNNDNVVFWLTRHRNGNHQTRLSTSFHEKRYKFIHFGVLHVYISFGHQLKWPPIATEIPRSSSSYFLNLFLALLKLFLECLPTRGVDQFLLLLISTISKVAA